MISQCLWRRFASGVALSYCVLVVCQTSAQDGWVASGPLIPPAEHKIYAALDEDTEMDFIATPIQDVMDYLSDRHGINIVIDTRALEAQGIGSDTPITKKFSGISLRSALRLMLRELDLTYIIQNEVLMITSLDEATKLTSIRVYNVAPLLEENETADYLAQVVQQTLRLPPIKSGSGGASIPGEAANTKVAKSARRITVYGQLLIVRDTTIGHEAVAQLLNSIQRGLDIYRQQAPPIVIPPKTQPEPENGDEPNKGDAPKTEPDNGN